MITKKNICAFPQIPVIANSSLGLISRGKEQAVSELRNQGLEILFMLLCPVLTLDEIFIQESFILL